MSDVQREVRAATSAVDRAFQKARDRTMPYSFLARAYKQNAAAWAELRDTLIQETSRAILLAKAEECHKAASHHAGCSNTGDEDWDAAAQAFSQRLYKRAAALRKAAEEVG